MANYGAFGSPIANGISEQIKYLEWTNNSDFYALVPPPLWSFYNNTLRFWLRWYDGYVPGIHGTSSGLLATRIGTTIVNRLADNVYGGGILFAINGDVKLKKKGVNLALDFISNEWSKTAKLVEAYIKSIRYAFAGGSALLKVNKGAGELSVETLRADRFLVNLGFNNKITSVKCFLTSNFRANSEKNSSVRYFLTEERYFQELPIGKAVPVVVYKAYSTASQVNNFVGGGACSNVAWEQLPKSVKRDIKEIYGNIQLDKPQAFDGIDNLGVFLVRATSGISSLPDVNLGESLLANILTYLYQYDYYSTAMQGDMYLGRGRVLIHKMLVNKANKGLGGNYNNGLDSFLFTQIEGMPLNEQKPEAIQFELRASDWRDIRNHLLENISSAIGISVGTLASYLKSDYYRNEAEISTSESNTTLFIANKRALFEDPFNEMLQTVLKYYGFTDKVEIRWSQTDKTNTTKNIENLTMAINAGLISKKKAHQLYNAEEDENQIVEDYEQIQREKQSESNMLYGEVTNGYNIE